MSDIIKLECESIFNANFDLLENNFKFIVNGTEYPTNKFSASLLSPIASTLITNNPSLDSFEINTTDSRGDFQFILNLINCREHEINNNDKEFICEVLEILKNSSIKIELNSNYSTITYENVFSHFLDDLRYPHYYKEIIEKDIKVISQNMYQIIKKENEKRILTEIDINFLEKIVNNPNLRLKSEDQLLEFVNYLYNINHEYSVLYRYVQFLFCSSATLKIFLDRFSFYDMDQNIWNQVKELLEYSNSVESDIRKRRRQLLFRKEDTDFDGVFRYLQNQTNNHIETEIVATSSSVEMNDNIKRGPYNSIRYDKQDKTVYFASQNLNNSWICFEFQNHRITPTHYTIKSIYTGDHAPVKYKVEILNENSDWEEIDLRDGNTFVNGTPAILTFPINKDKQKETNSIRLTQIGPNSHGMDFLAFDSIEFYGILQ